MMTEMSTIINLYEFDSYAYTLLYLCLLSIYIYIYIYCVPIPPFSYTIAHTVKDAIVWKIECLIGYIII